MDRDSPFHTDREGLFLMYLQDNLEPYQYPVAYCCRFPLFVEVENDHSGTVFCSKCSKEVMKFVKGGKGPDEDMFKFAQQ